MKKLPWLVYSSDDNALRQREEDRTRLASDDLHRYADFVRPRGLRLLLHESVDIAFNLQHWQLPADVVDARGQDAVGLALADVATVLVSGGGIFIGSPVQYDPRWRALTRPPRSHAELGSSALSGRYLGFVASGQHPAVYRPR